MRDAIIARKRKYGGNNKVNSKKDFKKTKMINKQKNMHGKGGTNGNNDDLDTSNSRMSDEDTDFTGFCNKEIQPAGNKQNEETGPSTSKNTQNDELEKKIKSNEELYRNNKYLPGDKGPYFVIMEKKGIEDLIVAEKLNSLNFGVILSVKQYGKHRVKVQTRELDTANKILKNVDLRKLYHYNAYIPNFLLETIGYINKIPVNTDMDKLKENMRANAKVTKVERISRWNNVDQKLEPTTAIKVTFRANSLPNDMTIYEVRRRIAYYIPKPMICKKCLIYGHTKKYCRGTEKCSKCAETNHTKQNCNNEAKCYYCDEKHITNNYLCEEFKKQKKIKYLMITKKITYREARNTVTPPEYKHNNEEFPPLNNTQNRETTQLKEEIQQIKTKLTTENEKLRMEITIIREQMLGIIKINRDIQATTQGYMEASANDPRNDLILTEMIQQLETMDKLITNNYKRTNNSSHA